MIVDRCQWLSVVEWLPKIKELVGRVTGLSRSVSVVKRRRVAPPSIAGKDRTLGDLVRL